MFEGFELERIDVGEAELRVRHGGSGSPLLLLHGHPRTHATWHRVAPLLARDYTVVCPDLRGYGESSKPATTPDHEPYSKRAMARDCVALMQALGHDRFAVAGHDRGCYVAFRADREAGGADHLRRTRRLVRHRPHRYGRGGIRRLAPRCTTRKRCTRCARTTVRVSESTATTMTRTGAPGDALNARLSLSGPAATTWRIFTATLSRSGATGSPTSAVVSESTAGTTWQKKPRTSLPKRSVSSSRIRKTDPRAPLKKAHG